MDGLTAKHGFTLIELLVVITIIGILAAIAIPQVARYRNRAFTAQIRSDLKNAASAQEAYLIDNTVYSDSVSGLTSRGYNQHSDITLGVNSVTSGGFKLTAEHAKCASGTWTFDSGAVGSSITGGPCS